MTVVVDQDAVLRTITRDDFLPAMTGFGQARSAAEAAIADHLARASAAGTRA
ncbi:MAG TPA: hypothetical protein VM299_03965 [Solirubrobacteraceae bacterium]|jgi:hypothetical protein|nr:hypothetical protein [Solirubrobacteraceae bacterium]